MNLYQKLIEIRKGVDFLKKGTQGHGYKFTPSSQVLMSVREEMNEHGVLLIPKVTGKEVSTHTTSAGKNWYFTELIMEFEWVNAENPEERFSVPWYGQGVDDAEKGVGKALTYAEKYLILKQFNIPTDKDDPDRGRKPQGTILERCTAKMAEHTTTEAFQAYIDKHWTAVEHALQDDPTSLNSAAEFMASHFAKLKEAG